MIQTGSNWQVSQLIILISGNVVRFESHWGTDQNQAHCTWGHSAAGHGCWDFPAAALSAAIEMPCFDLRLLPDTPCLRRSRSLVWVHLDSKQLPRRNAWRRHQGRRPEHTPCQLPQLGHSLEPSVEPSWNASIGANNHEPMPRQKQSPNQVQEISVRKSAKPAKSFANLSGCSCTTYFPRPHLSASLAPQGWCRVAATWPRNQ